MERRRPKIRPAPRRPTPHHGVEHPTPPSSTQRMPSPGAHEREARRTSPNRSRSGRARRSKPNWRQAEASPTSSTVLIHLPRRAERPCCRSIPQTQDHHDGSPTSAVWRQGRRASRGVVGARRRPKPDAHAPPRKHAGAAARRHQPPQGLCLATYAGSIGGGDEEEGLRRWRLGFHPSRPVERCGDFFSRKRTVKFVSLNISILKIMGS
jgi:hypothetical protein